MNNITGMIWFDMEYYLAVPLPPTSLQVADAGTDYLYFTWETDSHSTQDSYIVTVTDINNNSEIFRSDSITVQYHNLTGLEPGAVYSIGVDSVSNGEINNQTTRILDNTSK